jgi:hypothetical protein
MGGNEIHVDIIMLIEILILTWREYIHSKALV